MDENQVQVQANKMLYQVNHVNKLNQIYGMLFFNYS